MALIRILTCAAAAAMLAGAAVSPSALPSRSVAITIDDLPTVSVVKRDLAEAQRITTLLTGALRRNGVPAIGFVNERKLQPDGKVDPARVALLRQWLDAGLELGNHTFSHPDLHRIPIADFEREILAGEQVTRALLERAGATPAFFRHPFLHTGRDEETRIRLDRFLARHGYRVAPVTIDNDDYLFAAAFDRARAGGDPGAGPRVASTYLEYMEQVVAYYEQQAVTIVGHEIPQVLLLHANALNAEHLDGLAAMLRRRGYRFVSLGEALRDPAYQRRDTYYGPAGITWLHRWAITAGMKPSVFAGEPAVPGWIENAARPPADPGKLPHSLSNEEP